MPRKVETSLVAMLDRVAENYPDRGMTIIDEQGNTHRQSYAEIAEASKRAAVGWSKWVRKDDRILFALPTGFDFFAGFFGALRIGALPIPIAPLKESLDASDRAEFLWRVADRMRAKAILLGVRETQAAKPPELGVLEFVIDIADLIRNHEDSFVPNENEIAYIQTTSGATGTRRGVILEHASILENIASVGKALELSDSDSSCAWLPMYNVLGLVGVSLLSIYNGMNQILIDPGSFSNNANIWLETMSLHESTISVAPSHAYHFTARRTSTSAISKLNLQSIRTLLVGGEAVRRKHIELFQSTFSEAGLGDSVFTPVYGLSEATMGVTISTPKNFKGIKISRSELEDSGKIIPLDDSNLEANYLEFISSGVPIPGVELLLTDRRGIESSENELGFVSIRSNTLMRRYVLPGTGSTRRSGSWLITDDLGFLFNGELYLVAKDHEMIQTTDGRHLFAHEMEYELYEIDGVRLGSAMIFDANRGGFELVVAVELEPGAAPELIKGEILERLFRKFRLRPDLVELLSPHSIPRSPNGKIRRHLVEQFYADGILEKQTRRAEFDGVRKIIQRSRHSLWKWLRKRG